ncbi:ROK family protein [Ferroglobus placidus DSM 10642]|uniref:ROK family protein n=1 Tax=Ferroglobus placidus (strain DSM 10642 / AEDII12DO) TaxID=589924 RepID=D3S294_FERPA|nr:ROK family protein [Ferroglobus placidus]ADC66585.1 ROK family protein [Ferroglobus placidus DSM 10642]
MLAGVDVGGTFTDVVVKEGEEFVHVKTLKTSEFLKDPEFVEKYSNAVFAIAGWIRGGKILRTPNIPEFNAKLFEGKRIENDANCFAIYAHHVTGFENLFAVTLGTGVGGAIIADSKLYKGNGLASEIGHAFVGGDEKCVCGGVGHLETFFSGWTIKKKFGRELTREELIKFDGFKILCAEVARAVMILDPEAVVFGGRIASILEPEDFEQIYNFLPSEFRPEIRIIKDPLAVAKGAAILAGEKDGHG